MKRILTLLTVALIVVALMVVTAAPAFAANKNPHGKWTGQKNVQKCSGTADHPHCSNR